MILCPDFLQLPKIRLSANSDDSSCILGLGKIIEYSVVIVTNTKTTTIKKIWNMIYEKPKWKLELLLTENKIRWSTEMTKTKTITK